MSSPVLRVVLHPSWNILHHSTRMKLSLIDLFILFVYLDCFPWDKHVVLD